MNQPKRVMIISKILYLIFLFTFISCSSLGYKKHSFFNYYSDNFECTNSPETRNPAKFQKYLDLAWNPVRERYNQENLSISKVDVVIVGDSLIHMFHYPNEQLLLEQFPGINIYGRGIGGDTSGLLLNRLEANVLSLNPKTIIIEIGGNDLIFGVCLSTLEENIHKIIRLIRTKNKNTRILLLSVPPVGNKEVNSISPVYNLFLRTLTEEYENVQYIEFWKSMRSADSPFLKPEYARPNDKIHLNESAYKLWGEIIKPYLVKK